MGLFDNIFRPSPNKSSAALAKERLQIIVAHERGSRRGSPDYLPALKKSCWKWCVNTCRWIRARSRCTWIARAVTKFWS